MHIPISFTIWFLVGILLLVIAICAFCSKKPVGFWASTDAPRVTDVKRYNKAVGRLFIVVGIVFILLGTPLLFSKSPLMILVTVLGTMFVSIITMVVYTLCIETKYIMKDKTKGAPHAT